MRLSFGLAVMGELASYLSVFPLPNFREGVAAEERLADIPSSPHFLLSLTSSTHFG